MIIVVASLPMNLGRFMFLLASLVPTYNALILFRPMISRHSKSLLALFLSGLPLLVFVK